MDLPYGSSSHHAFVTGVGLITSTGPSARTFPSCAREEVEKLKAVMEKYKKI